MKKVFLLCIAALCFCATGLFAACDSAAGGRPAGETGDQVSEETPQIGGGGAFGITAGARGRRVLTPNAAKTG